MRGTLRVLVVAGTLAAAAPAGASTLSGSYFPFRGSCCESQVNLSYEAVPGERNDLTVSHSASLQFPLPRSVGFGDPGTVITDVPAPVVDPASGFGFVGLACVPMLVHVSCLTNATLMFVDVDLGDGNDRANGAYAYMANNDCGSGPCLAIAFDGGGGDDHLIGSPMPDEIDGGEGNDLLDPGSGGDLVRGGDGDDTVRLGIDGAPDRIFCGAGTDTVARFVVDPLDTIDADCEMVGP